MTEDKEIGEVKKIPSIQQIEWCIPEFFTVVQDRKYRYLVSSTFPVAGILWHLRLFPCEGPWQLFLASEDFRKRRSCYLEPDAHREYSLEYEFGLKDCYGIVENSVRGIVEKNEASNNSDYDFISKTQLLERKSELVPDNVLTIVCIMKWVTEVSQSSIPPETELDSRTKVLKLIRLDKLSENFKDLYGAEETCDVLLKVEEKEYKAHRSVLIARSSVFASTFKHDTLERQTGLINIPDCDSDSFQEFLYYLYSGKLEELTYHKAQNLYYTSDKYDVKELKAFCIEYLMQCLTVENVCEVAVFADKYDEIQLYKTVEDFFIKNSFKILLTSEWGHFLKNDWRLGNKLLKEMAKMNLKK